MKPAAPLSSPGIWKRAGSAFAQTAQLLELFLHSEGRAPPPARRSASTATPSRSAPGSPRPAPNTAPANCPTPTYAWSPPSSTGTGRPRTLSRPPWRRQPGPFHTLRVHTAAHRRDRRGSSRWPPCWASSAHTPRSSAGRRRRPGGGAREPANEASCSRTSPGRGPRPRRSPRPGHPPRLPAPRGPPGSRHHPRRRPGHRRGPAPDRRPNERQRQRPPACHGAPTIGRSPQGSPAR